MNNSKETYLEIFHSIDFNEIKKHPNILIAANFWEEERFRAAKVCYRLMREIDDMIDDYKSVNPGISKNAGMEFKDIIRVWMNKFRKNGAGFNNTQLTEMFNAFKIPVWPFREFAESMNFDIDHSGFSTLQQFIDYSQGASVAPASVFVHLCGVKKKNHNYYKPDFNVRKAATPCAMFSYIVHIIRDFQIDQKNNLNYFAGDMLRKFEISESDLRYMANDGKVNENFREMAGEYMALAEQYMNKTCRIIREIWPLLDERYRLSLLIIFNLYRLAFEKIDIKNGNFTQVELEPSASEIRERVLKVISEFDPEYYRDKIFMATQPD